MALDLRTSLFAIEAHRPGSLRRIASGYEESVYECLAGVRRGLDACEIDVARAALHRLCGTSAQLGALEVASMCRALLRDDAELDVIAAGVDRLESVARRSVIAFAALAP